MSQSPSPQSTPPSSPPQKSSRNLRYSNILDDSDNESDIYSLNETPKLNRNFRESHVNDSDLEALMNSSNVTASSNIPRRYGNAERRSSVVMSPSQKSSISGVPVPVSPSHSTYTASSIRSSLQDSLDNKLNEETRALWERNKQLNRENKDLLGEVDQVVREAQEVQTRKPQKRHSEASAVSRPTRQRPLSSQRTRRTSVQRDDDTSSVRSGSAAAQQTISTDDADADELEQAARGMGADAQLIFYKSRVKALEAELKKMAEQNKEKDKQASEKHKIAKEMNLLKKQSQSKLSSMEKQLERTKKELTLAQSKHKNALKEITTLKSEIDELKANQRGGNAPGSAGGAGNNVRYMRAVEEVDKLKQQIKDLRREQKDKADETRKEHDRLEQHNKKLERQKQEIMNAFQKQMKLIDILKRQKIHLEAAKMLNFTEQEFAKALDFGQ